MTIYEFIKDVVYPSLNSSDKYTIKVYDNHVFLGDLDIEILNQMYSNRDLRLFILMNDDHKFTLTNYYKNAPIEGTLWMDDVTKFIDHFIGLKRKVKIKEFLN